MVIGVGMVAGYSIWKVASSVGTENIYEGSHVPAPESSNFLVATSLSKEQQDRAWLLYKEAEQLADIHARRAAQADRWSYFLQWASFSLSSLLVVIAGYFGRIPSDETAQKLLDSMRPAGTPQPAGEGHNAKGDKVAPTRKERAAAEHEAKARQRWRARFASIVGVIAAMSAVANGAESRLQAGAVQSRQTGRFVSEAAVKTSKVTAQPTDERDVDASLQELQQVIRDNSS
jgi:hypothetical protein